MGKEYHEQKKEEVERVVTEVMNVFSMRFLARYKNAIIDADQEKNRSAGEGPALMSLNFHYSIASTAGE